MRRSEQWRLDPDRLARIQPSLQNLRRRLSMDWRKSYDEGIAAYKVKDYHKCLRLLNEVRQIDRRYIERR